METFEGENIHEFLDFRATHKVFSTKFGHAVCYPPMIGFSIPWKFSPQGDYFWSVKVSPSKVSYYTVSVLYRVDKSTTVRMVRWGFNRRKHIEKRLLCTSHKLQPPSSSCPNLFLQLSKEYLLFICRFSKLYDYGHLRSCSDAWHHPMDSLNCNVINGQHHLWILLLPIIYESMSHYEHAISLWASE